MLVANRVHAGVCAQYYPILTLIPILDDHTTTGPRAGKLVADSHTERAALKPALAVNDDSNIDFDFDLFQLL